MLFLTVVDDSNRRSSDDRILGSKPGPLHISNIFCLFIIFLQENKYLVFMQKKISAFRRIFSKKLQFEFSSSIINYSSESFKFLPEYLKMPETITKLYDTIYVKNQILEKFHITETTVSIFLIEV